MSIKCNMTEEEREQYAALFRRPTYEELKKSRGGFVRYLFYDTWGRKDYREYFCPNCGRFEIERPYEDVYCDDPFMYHHNDQAQCPMCCGEYQLICLGRMRNMSSLRQWGKLLFMWAEGGTLMMSAGFARRDFNREDLDPVPEFFETARFVVMPGKRQMWRRKSKWNGRFYEHGILPTKSFGEPFATTHYEGFALKNGETYVVGVEGLYKTDMRYCQLVEFASEQWNVDLMEYDDTAEPVRGVVAYLGEYSRRPQIEMLVKLGYGDVVQSMLCGTKLPGGLVNWRAKTPADFFRLSKKEFRVFREKNGKLEDIASYRNRDTTAEDMNFDEYLGACSWLRTSSRCFFEECKSRGVRAKKVLRYLQEQAPIGAYGEETFNTWTDYLHLAGELERDLSFMRNLLPQDLRQEHDAALELVEDLRDAKYALAMKDSTPEKSYGKRYRKLKRMYAYNDGELEIVIPVNAEDIEREGKRLRHCVGGYAKRHIEGKTTILFLRKADNPTRRYVTIEINDATKKIRQVHGYRNDVGGISPLDRHPEFFEKWLDWLERGSPRARNGKPIQKQRIQEAKTA